MNKTYLATIITAFSGILITTIVRQTTDPNDRMLGLGVLIIAMTIFFALTGIVLSIFKQTRSAARGVFLGMGIQLVIGFAICSV